jgi:hypothetical protein
MPAFINKLENITSPSMGPVEPIDEAGWAQRHTASTHRIPMRRHHCSDLDHRSRSSISPSHIIQALWIHIYGHEGSPTRAGPGLGPIGPWP